MKRQIRRCVFETNSSSVHSIAIPKECNIIDQVSFSCGEFGWEFAVADPADYFYTAIFGVSNTKEELDERISRLKDILDSRGVKYYMPKDYRSDGYIDHGNELREFVDDLLSDGDKLVRFLSDGLVFTGNDNTFDGGYLEPQNEFIEKYNWSTLEYEKIKNEHYMENHKDYEWFLKTN